jgi:hypothetical protein
MNKPVFPTSQSYKHYIAAVTGSVTIPQSNSLPAQTTKEYVHCK